MKCERCRMEGVHAITTQGVVRYYCAHHISKEYAGMSVINSIRELLPLLTMFGVVTGITIATSYVQGDLSLMGLMMNMMAYFFLVFGIFKLFNLHAFADAYQTYDIIAKRSRLYALAYPFIEISLGVLYLFWLGGIWRDGITFALMSIGTLGVWYALQKKDEIPCACLGMVFTVPMTKITLLENVLMAGMALVMVGASLVGMPM